MRFFVECAFPHLGKRGAVSRKSAFCYLRLTEKHILLPASHGKVHSGLIDSRKDALCDSAIPRSRRMRLSVTSRRPGGVGQPPRQAAGHYGEWLNWANALEQPPASLRGGLRQGPQISVRSLASRKSALCPTGGLQNALFRHDATAECAFP